MAEPVAFVGREGELSRLLAALARHRAIFLPTEGGAHETRVSSNPGRLAGDARLVLVVGDAGVGKTRFVAEGMARAEAAGVVTVRGECLPLAETLPLRPVAAALGELARLEGGGLLEGALNSAPEYVRGQVGRLLPELGSDGGPGTGGRDEGWQRERLFSAVAELLDAGARSPEPGSGWWSRTCTGRTARRWSLLTFLVRGGCRGAVSVVATSPR